MAPTLLPGDRIVVVRAGRPSPGRMVSLSDPRRPERTVVKRVVSVDAAGVTVAGDNPHASTDSRTFGPVPPGSVKGRVLYRYHPPDRRQWLAAAGPVRTVGTLGPMWSDEVDQALSDDSLADLESRPFEDVRALRSELSRMEDKVSYLRRLVQGRLDIVGAELRRRSDGGSPSDLANLVDRLPEILSDHIHAPGPGRLSTHLVPPDDEALTADLDQVAAPGLLAALSDLSDDELNELVLRLNQFERSVSERRRALFDRIDALQAEVTRRYRTGEARAESLLDDRSS